jgi:hypothetical protein
VTIPPFARLFAGDLRVGSTAPGPTGTTGARVRSIGIAAYIITAIAAVATAHSRRRRAG